MCEFCELQRDVEEVHSTISSKNCEWTKRSHRILCKTLSIISAIYRIQKYHFNYTENCQLERYLDVRRDGLRETRVAE